MSMTAESPDELTVYLRRWREGDREALDTLLSRVYDRLRAMARARLRHERDDHTLDTSGLVHEAYLRMAGRAAPDLQDRAHFFAVASTAMRRVLIDHAKQRLTLKRGGNAVRVNFDAASWGEGISAAATAEPDALVALDEALIKLEGLHARQAKAIELRYFAGLTLEEVAQVLGTSAPTVMRDLRFAEAWLARELA
jgi:RNA polymerase sigma-70 factor (ECF subfamily)